MCGRGTQEFTWAEVRERMMIIRPEPGDAPNIEAKYNVPPTTKIWVVRQGDGGRELVRMNWELIPFWWGRTRKEKKFSTFNAKAETLREAKSYRTAWKAKQRCIIPFNFFEWKRAGKTKTLFYIYPTEAYGSFFLMAGLWDKWKNPETGEYELGCTIITVEPNEFMANIHNRMPAILAHDDIETWLTGDPDDAYALLKPCPSEWMRAHEVASGVGNVRNQGPECIEPLLDLGP